MLRSFLQWPAEKEESTRNHHSKFRLGRTSSRSSDTKVRESNHVRVRVQRISTDIEIDTSIWRCAIYGFLLEPTPDGLEKAKVHIGVLREHFSKLAEIIQKCHGQYYRYHCEWSRETQNVVSLLGSCIG